MAHDIAYGSVDRCLLQAEPPCPIGIIFGTFTSTMPWACFWFRSWKRLENLFGSHQDNDQHFNTKYIQPCHKKYRNSSSRAHNSMDYIDTNFHNLVFHLDLCIQDIHQLHKVDIRTRRDLLRFFTITFASTCSTCFTCSTSVLGLNYPVKPQNTQYKPDHNGFRISQNVKVIIYFQSVSFELRLYWLNKVWTTQIRHSWIA